MLESIGELPSHPLFVHAPVVLTPLVAIFALVLLVRPAWRRQAGPALPAASVGLAVSTYLAMESGERFEDLLGDFAPNLDTHRSLATTSLIMILMLVVSSLAMVVTDRMSRNDGSAAWLARVTPGLCGLAAVFAGLATIWMFRTGHEGARLVWKGTVQSLGVVAGV